MTVIATVMKLKRGDHLAANGQVGQNPHLLTSFSISSQYSGRILAPPFTSCRTLDKFLNLHFTPTYKMGIIIRPTLYNYDED